MATYCKSINIIGDTFKLREHLKNEFRFKCITCNINMTEWKEIRNNIVVSTTGIVKNTKTGYIYKTTIKNGYHCSTYLGNKSIHRLVAETFIPNPNNYNTVNHINEDKLDNRVENLEWVSQKQNINKFNENNNRTLKIKIVDMYYNDKYIKSFNNVLEASKEVGVSRTAISKCCNGKHKTSNGYVFKFRDKEDHSLDDNMKDIKDYNYQISDNGKVYNKKTKKVLKHCKNANGNYYVTLTNANGKRNFYIHRLVFETFKGDIPDKKQVIHIDGDKSNQYIENLKLL